jgi:hypothetical protein
MGALHGSVAPLGVLLLVAQGLFSRLCQRLCSEQWASRIGIGMQRTGTCVWACHGLLHIV